MQDSFTNQQVDTSSLPSIDTLSFRALHKDYLTALMIRAIIFWVVFLIIIISVIFLNDQEYPDILNYVALCLILVIMLTSIK